MKGKYTITLGLLLLLTTLVKSQTIGIDQTALNLGSLPDTIRLGDSYTHTITAQNTGTDSITGFISLEIGRLDTGNNFVTTNEGGINVTNLLPNDTIGIIYTQEYSSNNGFTIGDNVVVVWPAAPGLVTQDTIFRNVHILSPIGKIGIDTSQTNLASLPDTITEGESYTHTITIENKGIIPIDGTVRLIAAHFVNNSIAFEDTVVSTVLTNFDVDSTLSLSYTETYSFSNDYTVGDNVIVVWPYLPGTNTVDTLFRPVYIDPAVYIDEIKSQNQLVIYPNPAHNTLFIRNIGTDLLFKHVRIMSVEGQIVYDRVFQPTIDIINLSKGVYFLEVFGEHGEEYHYKFVKN